MNKQLIVSEYLGPYLDIPSKELREQLQSFKTGGCNLIQTANHNAVITYFLLKEGRQNYIVFSSYQIIDIYLGNVEEYNSLSNITSPVVIVSAREAEMENKQRWSLLYQLAMIRVLRKQGLTIITEKFPMDLNVFKTLGFETISVASNLRVQKMQVGDDF